MFVEMVFSKEAMVMLLSPSVALIRKIKVGQTQIMRCLVTVDLALECWKHKVKVVS